MVKKYSSHVWIGQCALRLMQLKPGMSMFEAVQTAAANHPYAAHLEPERAADMLLAACPEGEANLG
jgi:hypothetical protein